MKGEWISCSIDNMFPPSKKPPSSQRALHLDEGDILSDLEEKSGSSLFLGKYTFKAVERVLKKRNFFKEAQKRKLWPLVFYLNPAETPPLQRFQIFYESRSPDNIVVDLKIRQGTFSPASGSDLDPSLRGLRFLMLEWLTLQNPLKQFSDKRAPLPGQSHPGLGLGRKVLDLFTYLARVTRSDGILAYPAYFHNAFLFSRRFRFLNPEKRAEVMAICQSVEGVPFKDLAWIVHLECIEEEGKGRFKWEAEEQIFPLNPDLKKWLNSPEYKERVKAALQERRFRIDWECFEQKRSQITQGRVESP